MKTNSQPMNNTTNDKSNGRTEKENLKSFPKLWILFHFVQNGKKVVLTFKKYKKKCHFWPIFYFFCSENGYSSVRIATVSERRQQAQSCVKIVLIRKNIKKIWFLFNFVLISYFIDGYTGVLLHHNRRSFWKTTNN